MLHVYAKITPKPEYYDRAKIAVESIVSATVKEAGCARFEFFTDLSGTSLHLVETWVDQAALDAHYAQPYTVSVFEAYQNWLAKPPEIQLMSRVA
ncbi:putative quinol monooxygenase [Ponticaulis sp.]|uniref:putative quinol monooxygenase n=1 Tax=Ponticaulis sp. TaxID=2020902 RepID=UPI000B64E688|nr:putative quinol monooxygenase [Ponticaulis sp.]MAJ07903.1 antibiotic biosynthesis monooxygenase [Ponticaulis sp.]RPG18215.1 MAG: antibiotic biosynthesis monooxygenase [Hyphomonadaceae bacterium TMED125]HBH90402.1 antibiotic biosynthesis monooxygenase [Hyphomonadaceae bacterium]HBJ93411.1 antibiotic biosynthesis monooxygenase [Hyphomonadaceae bacterium]